MALINGIPESLLLSMEKISRQNIFGIETPGPIAPTQLQPPIVEPKPARPSRIHTPTLNSQVGKIQISATFSPEEFDLFLMQSIGRATGQGVAKVSIAQDPWAIGGIAIGLSMLMGVGGFAIASMSSQTPVAIQQEQLRALEKSMARESAATRKIAEKAIDKKGNCISFNCGGY